MSVADYPTRSEPSSASFHAAAGTDSAVEAILLRLLGAAVVDDDHRSFLQTSLGPAIPHRLGAELGDDGDGSCRFLVSGWACRVRESPWGGRLILDFVLPGDPIGLSLTPGGGGHYRVLALTRGTTVNAIPFRDHLRAPPDGLQWERFRTACHRSEQSRACRLHDHTVRLGAPTATQGMIHLLLELRSRMAEIGELEGGKFPMPLGQETLSHALGITVTQVYRILVQLRRDGLIALGPGWMNIPDVAALANAARLEGGRG